MDAICDGTDVFVRASWKAGGGTASTSGDSVSVYPTFLISQAVKDTILDYTRRLGMGIGIVGLYNIQFIVDRQEKVYIIEVNPRSSRTVPFLLQAPATSWRTSPPGDSGGEACAARALTGSTRRKAAVVLQGARVSPSGKLSGWTPICPRDEVTGEAISLRRTGCPTPSTKAIAGRRDAPPGPPARCC